MYLKYFKRIFDFLLALFLILALSPPLVILIIVNFFAVRGKVFFHQKRVGYKKNPFDLIKFKTLIDASQATDNKHVITDSLTKKHFKLPPWGRKLRASSLDELPQLFNILKGEMSFVGPRPLPVIYMNYYTKEEQKRHDVKPGLTGLAQVSGRNELPWNERLQMDVDYVEKVCLTLDFKILWRTFLQLFKSQEVDMSVSLIDERTRIPNS